MLETLDHLVNKGPRVRVSDPKDCELPAERSMEMKRTAGQWSLDYEARKLEEDRRQLFSAAPVDLQRGSGVCMMSTTWRDEQHPSFISFVSSFLNANAYRLNFLPIAPDFIFNNGGVSVAFIFVTNWDCDNPSAVFVRVEKLKRQFGHLYVVVSVPTREQNDSFNHAYFKYTSELGSPTFVPVRDPEMGFEKIVKIAHVRGVCKRQDAVSMMKLERKRAVQDIDVFLRVLTSISGIDNHDAHALVQAVGSIEAISKASKSFIMENTDLSVDKAERIVRFFRDPKYYLSPKIN